MNGRHEVSDKVQFIALGGPKENDQWGFRWRVGTFDYGFNEPSPKGYMSIGTPGLTTLITPANARQMAADLIKMAEIIEKRDGL